MAVSFATKGGGAQRARRRRRAERKVRRYPQIEARIARNNRSSEKPAKQLEKPVNLAGPWTIREARVALRRQAESGMSQRAFAEAEGFPVGRLSTWRKRLEVDRAG
jgi:hypothetical protein